MIQRILLLVFLLSGFSSQGAVILKKRNQQALLHLEGLRTSPGAYFDVVDGKGKSRGLIQIKRLSRNKRKAIGVLRSGQMAANWALEPVNRRTALRKLRKSEEKQALLKKRRSVRKLASARVRRKRASAKRKGRRPSRYLANVDEDIQEEADYIDSTQNEQYVIDDQSSPPPENYYNPDFLEESSENDGSMNLVIGVSTAISGNFMKLRYEDISLLPTGLGFNGQVFLEGTANDSIRWNIYGGYRKFSVSSQDSLCNRRGCFLGISYLTGGAGLKFIVKENKTFKLWGGVQGHMLYLLGYDNDIEISSDELDDVTITRDSFGILHGDLGLSFGADIKLRQNFVIPLALESHLIIPPTATVITGNIGLRVGVGWKF